VHERQSSEFPRLSFQGDVKALQIASDLHIEFYGTFQAIPDDIIVPASPILALIGDIGLACTDLLEQFLLHQASHFEHVLLIAGNHEFYNGSARNTVDKQLKWIQNVCDKRSNLHFMHNKGVYVGENLILGTSLWSHIPDSVYTQAQFGLNDYHQTLVREEDGSIRKLTPSDTNAWHKRDVEWLSKELEAAKTRPETVIVLTHHTPLMKGTSAPQYYGDALSHCFSTNIPQLLDDPVEVWISGHTHFNYDFEYNGVRLLSNQAGYRNRINNSYGKQKTIPL